MARLFTGIALPPAVVQKLQALQPSPMPGIRLVKAEQMHLTLHFIGEGEVEVYRQGLEKLRSPHFSITIEALGKFANRKETILWAGVRESTELQSLHREMEAVLVMVGYQPEMRPYHPHLTLARCDGRVPGEVVEAFLTQPFEPDEFRVNEVVLFSSVLSSQGPTYHQEFVIQLR
ncbi:MAG: RNA 2',3'-cyclic phosphodiesterase [Planctomycetia bacterium]|nr:RNA 2',3'-cyclic phosphodiesterase [Planctomycetia bacterium]